MFWSKEPTLLEMETDRAVFSLKNHPVHSQEYAKALNHVQALHAMKMAEKPSTRVSADTWVAAGANLLGILMIIHTEHLNPITSKALSFVLRPRI